MKDGPIFTVLIAVVCGVGFASQWETADRFLSTVFAWLFLAGGGAVLLIVGVREAWDAWQDWQVIGPPDLAPLRRRREDREADEEKTR
jgi:hypothetical protein